MKNISPRALHRQLEQKKLSDYINFNFKLQMATKGKQTSAPATSGTNRKKILNNQQVLTASQKN